MRSTAPAKVALATSLVLALGVFSQAQEAGRVQRPAVATPPRPLPNGITDVGTAPIPAEEFPAEEVAARLTGVYELANQATTQAEMDKIVRLCARLLNSKLTKAQELHAKRLSAWAEYQRGELLLDEASRAYRRQDKTAAPEDEAPGSGDAAKIEAALQAFRRSHADDPELARARFGMGVCFAMQGNYRQAADCFLLVTQDDPQFAEAFINLGECQLAVGEAELAVESFAAGIALQPQDPSAYTGRGHALLELGETDQALLDYKRCVQLLPNHPTAFLNRGDAYRADGQWEKALDDYLAARKLTPQSPLPFQRMAWLMATCPDARQRNEAAAYDLALQAIQLQGRADARLLDTLAAAQAANGWFSDAQETLARAKQLDPAGFGTATEHRAELYQAEKPYLDQIRVKSFRR